LLLLTAPAAAQAPAYFDDFTYARVGTRADGPAAGALLGTNAWLAPDGGYEMTTGWRLGSDDETHTGPASAYFGGPGSVALAGDGGSRHVSLGMEAGFPFREAEYARPPLLHTAQVFPSHGTFAARVRFSSLEEGQRMIEAFWLFVADQYRFCPPVSPECDVRTPPPGTLSHAVEMDFEYNNWFLAEPIPHIHSTAIRYRETGTSEEPGSNSIALSCTESGVRRDLCRGVDGRSLIPGQWYVLAFQVDSTRGTVEFEVVEDAPSGVSGIRGTGRQGEQAIVRRTRGGRQEPFVQRFPVAMFLSLHYMGRAPSGPQPRCARRGDTDVTCRAHSMQTDWVYHSRVLQTSTEVSDEVSRWRRRGESRVNTLAAPTMVVAPALRPAAGDPARLVLRLYGPRSVSDAATWTVRPASVRGIAYRMDIQLETVCGAGGCVPRILSPRAPTFEVTPLPGETGMVVRARLFDPWWGYTQVSSPGSTWREWRVSFR